MEMCAALNKMVRKGLIEMKVLAQRLEVRAKELCMYLERSVPGRRNS